MKKSLYLLAIATILSISYTPAIAEDYYFRAKEATIGMNGSAEGINVESPIILETTTNTLYSITKQPSATGGITPYVWSVTGDSELGINSSTGELSGKPTTAGLKTVNILVTDSQGKQGTTTVQVQVYDNISISDPEFGILIIGNPINVTKQPNGLGGNGTYTWSLSSGPSWLYINSSNGHLTGTPTIKGNFSFNLIVNDTSSHSFSKTIYGNVVKIPEINIVNNGVTTFTVGDSYNQQFTIDSDPAGITYATGTIPDGTSLIANDNSAEITGILSKAGNFDYQLNTTNANGIGISNNINVNVYDKLLLSSFTIDNTIIGDNYNVVSNPVATGGNGSYTYSIDSQTNGTGLNINSSTGELSGTPTTSGTKTVTVKVVDGNGNYASKTNNFNIYDTLALSNFSISTPITISTPYIISSNPIATGGNNIYIYSIESQTEGTGLSVNSSTGELSGTPTTAGSKTVVIKVVDGNNQEKTVNETFNVYDVISLTDFTIPDSILNTAYTGITNSVATGGNGSYTYTIESQTAGTDLSINSSTGELSGTPTTSGNKTVTIRVTDSDGRTITKSTTFNVYATLVLNSPVFGTSTVLSPVVITSQPSASGASGTYTWSLSENPSWMSINSSTGIISGTPNIVGDFTTKVIVTSGTQTKTSSVISGTVQTPVLTLATTTLADKRKTDSISQDFKPLLITTGVYDVNAIVWSSQNLPTGLTINSSNSIVSGTVLTTGTYNFTITATFIVNNIDYISSQNYSIVIKNNVDFSKVSSGSVYTCAVTTVGGVKCWGTNGNGQLGNGTTTQSSIPIDTQGLNSNIISITTGNSHTCALTTNGGVKCWGYNGSGQLGNNSTTQSLMPIDVTGLTSGISSISAGQYYTCALTTNGGVKCWGSNQFGQLGINSLKSSLIPVDVQGLTSGVASISSGVNHACAVTKSGGVKCWGQNNGGQLGNNSTTNSLVPVDVTGLSSGVVSISAGQYNTCVITTNSGVKCWGSLITNGTNANSSIPVDVQGLSGIVNISSGYGQTCAITTTGAVKCFGMNGSGQLGNNTKTNSSTPVNAQGLTTGISNAGSGVNHTCVVAKSGAVKCWGNNDYGQLGNNTKTQSLIPIDIF